MRQAIGAGAPERTAMVRSRRPDADGLAELIEELRRRVTSLVDPVEIAAALESMGFNDQVVRDRFHARDIFELADTIVWRLRYTGPVMRAAPVRWADEPTGRRQAVVDYLRGPLALIPIVMLLLIVAAFGQVGSWGASTTLAFSVGMTGSMLVTNCFVQAFSRRGAIYVSREDLRSAGAFVSSVVRLAVLAVLVIAVIAVAMLETLRVFALGESLIFAGAFVALSLVWLLAGVLALVRAPAMLAGAMGLGMAAGFVVDQGAAAFSAEHVVIGSAAGYAVAVGAMLLVARQRYEAGGRGEPRPALPSLAYQLDEAIPYFVYGALYMALVLLPHVLAWTAVVRTEADQIGAATSFEVALTVSLLPIVVAGGLAERSARLFWLTARSAQRQTRVVEAQMFAKSLLRFYGVQLARYLVVLTVISVLAYAAFVTDVASSALRSIIPTTSESLVQLLFAGSLIGYGLLGWGLFNCIFIVGLGQPSRTIPCLRLGLVATLVAGVPLALGLHFGYAVVAFGVGATVFALGSFVVAYTLLASADYHYYAAS